MHVHIHAEPGDEMRALHCETLPTVIINYVFLPLLPASVCVRVC